MSNTLPSGPDIVNTKALEGFMRAFDKAMGYRLGNFPKFDTQGTMVEASKPTFTIATRAKRIGPSCWRPSFWRSPLKTIVFFLDDLRLRKYNREWIKNNIH